MSGIQGRRDKKGLGKCQSLGGPLCRIGGMVYRSADCLPVKIIFIQLFI